MRTMGDRWDRCWGSRGKECFSFGEWENPENMTGVVAFQFGEDSHRWDEREDTWRGHFWGKEWALRRGKRQEPGKEWTITFCWSIGTCWGPWGMRPPKGWRVENILWRGLECWEGARGVKTKCNQQSSTLGGFWAPMWHALSSEI